MQRQVVLDTETTGLDPASGHRIIEIGCVELIQRQITQNRYHQYIQPDREVDPGAVAVHGITNDFLVDKPRIEDVIDDFIEFIKGAELIIHNAPFDVGFIDAELERLGKSRGNTKTYCTVVDTLAMARRMFPGSKNSLDALCKRYAVDNTQRELHGALLDAELLAEVYLQMTGGQTSLMLEARSSSSTPENVPQRAVELATKVSHNELTADLPVIRANQQEQADHNDYVQFLEKQMGAPCVWQRIDEKKG